MSQQRISIEVAYATPQRQKILSLEVPTGCTVREAILASGIIESFPEIDLKQQAVGVFSKLVTLETALEEHDRIEIYRELIADPKEARRQRAEKKKQQKKAAQ